MITIQPQNKAYRLYMIECGDNSIYTGIALDVDKRFERHQKGKGSKYARSRLPLKLVFISPPIGGRGEAMKLEYRVKQLTHRQKLAIIDENTIL